MVCGKNTKHKTKQYRNFYQGDYVEINNQLTTTNWDKILTNTQNINDKYTKFLNVIQDTIQKHIPWKKPKNKTTVPKLIKVLLKIKVQSYKRIKDNPHMKYFYKEISKIYREAVKQNNKHIENKIMTTNNARSFYSYVNKKLKTPTILPPMHDANSKVLIQPEEKANLLNSCFSKVFISDDNQKPLLQSLINNTTIREMPLFQITPSMVKKSISHLKNSVSQTPDNIPSFFLKKTSNSLANPLAYIFNCTIHEKQIPDIWRRAIVIPIHKKGLKNNPHNYRPVSLTSVVCRTEEHIIHEHITLHTTENNILSETQHGFLTKRSTLTQQLQLVNQLTLNYENNTTTDIIYLDFAKAFDTVPHNKLIHILKHIKINPLIIIWIQNFLQNRSQQTAVENSLSKSCSITSGVPQGSVLGPQLFTLFLNILLRELESIPQIVPYAFADDLKIISTHPQQLQTSLDTITAWSKLWQLKINPTKSEHIQFTSRTQPQTQNTYKIDNQTIQRTKAVRDLGICLTEDLKWSVQTSKVHSKAIPIMYTILRSFRTQNPNTYTTLYKTYVRPIIEYNCSIWNPNQYIKYQTPINLSDIRRIESVQTKFTRLLCQKLNINYDNYQHRLNILQMETLESRRLKADLILVYKFQNNLIDLNMDEFFTKSNLNTKYTLRRHENYLQIPSLCNTTIRRNFFSNRIVKVWNHLPKELITSKSLLQFKSKLDKINLHEFAQLTNF